MKMVNAIWIDVLPQWNLSSIGVTNRVHPYWRLAIIDMQMMPMISCTQRLTSGARKDCADAIGSAICPAVRDPFLFGAHRQNTGSRCDELIVTSPEEETFAYSLVQ